MLVAQDSGKMVLLTQQVKKETLAHDQVDINKWLMWCPDNCPGKKSPPLRDNKQLPPRIVAPEENFPQIIALWMVAPGLLLADNCSEIITPWQYCLEIDPEENRLSGDLCPT